MYNMPHALLEALEISERGLIGLLMILVIADQWMLSDCLKPTQMFLAFTDAAFKRHPIHLPGNHLAEISHVSHVSTIHHCQVGSANYILIDMMPQCAFPGTADHRPLPEHQTP